MLCHLAISFVGYKLIKKTEFKRALLIGFVYSQVVWMVMVPLMVAQKVPDRKIFLEVNFNVLPMYTLFKVCVMF